jgi:hypothetical protein
MENNENKGGPQTPEGKEISKMNALKHGLLSKEVLLKEDDPELFEELANGISEVLLPVGKMEEILVDRIISSTWRLRRAIQVERGTMQWFKEYDDMFSDFGGGGDKELKKIKEMIDNGAIERTIRYENSIERSLFKALHELERLQARRNGKNVPLPIPVDVETSRSDY